ncbi:MAG: hypothetical protein VKQ33_00315 [Candidatus Sericytochromatia bacterium]|nr:hypothetical protein [Candidatus Sericytochromatia bacterium]
MSPPTPQGFAGEPPPTNQMRLQAQNAWVKLPGTNVSANVPHVDATLVDRTPGDPLTPLAPDSYELHVRSGALQVLDVQATELLREAGGHLLAQHRLRDTQVRFLANGRVRVAATAERAGLPLPVSLDFKLSRRDAHTVTLEPAFSWLTRLGLGAMGVDLMQQLAKAVPGSRLEPGGGLAFDLRALPRVHADLQALSIRSGKLEAQLGTGPRSARPPGSREGASNWVAIETRGEATSPQGILRNGRTFARGEGGAENPILLNEVPKWVTMRRDAGEIVLDREAVAATLAEQLPSFKVKHMRFEGSALELKGHYRLSMAALGGLFGLALGGAEGLVRGLHAGAAAKDLGVPVTARIEVSTTPDGRARLTPSGSDMVADLIRGQLAELSGARAEGEAVLLDLSRLSGVELGPLRRVRAEGGRLVMGFDAPTRPA